MEIARNVRTSMRFTRQRDPIALPESHGIGYQAVISNQPVIQYVGASFDTDCTSYDGEFSRS